MTALSSHDQPELAKGGTGDRATYHTTYRLAFIVLSGGDQRRRTRVDLCARGRCCSLWHGDRGARCAADRFAERREEVRTEIRPEGFSRRHVLPARARAGRA